MRWWEHISAPSPVPPPSVAMSIPPQFAPRPAAPSEPAPDARPPMPASAAAPGATSPIAALPLGVVRSEAPPSSGAAPTSSIALDSTTNPRNASLSYRPVGQSGEHYPDWIRALDGKSGVYVIRELGPDGKPEIVYVGSSSADRLYGTLTRHFQSWRRWKGFWRGQYGEGHDPGLTYDRSRVDVAVRITPASRALDEEARLIRRLRPRDNLIGQPEEEAVPF